MRNSSAVQRWVLASVFALLSLGCDSKTAAEHIDAAKVDIESGELRVAIIELKNAIQKDPQSAEARSLLGQLYLKYGDLPSALKELERATDLGATDDATQLALLRTRNGLGRYSEVVGELEERPRLSPPFAVVLADAYMLAGDVQRARPLYQQAQDLPEGLLGMSRLEQRDNNLERALSFASQATAADPANREAWMQKADVELHEGAYEAALASFNTARGLPGGDLVGQLGLVRAHLLADDLDAAQREVDDLVTRVPDFLSGQYLKGLISFRRGDMDAAEAALRKVQQATRQHLPTLYLMGAVKAQQGQLGQAEDSLRRYLAQDSDNVSVRKLLASIYNAQNKPASVVDALEEVAPRHADPQLWAMLGSAYMRTGQMARATEAFQNAVEIAPDMVPFRNQLALSLLSAGEDEEAVAELASAIEIDQDQFQSEYLLAMVRLRDEDFAGATEAVEAIIGKSADNPIGYDLKGTILLRQKQETAAKQQFELALEKDPGYLPAADNLARLAERDGDIDAAKAFYDRVLQADGNNQEAELAKIDLVVRQGDLEEGLRLLRIAVNRYPESTRAHLGLLRLLLATGNLSEAESAAEKAVQYVGEVPQILLLQGDIELRSGDQDEAQRIATQLQTLLKQFDQNKTLLAALGNLQLRLGDLSVARGNLELAAQGESGSTRAMVDLARLELAERNPAAAADRVSQLNAAGVTGEEVSLLEADILLAQQKYDAARSILEPMAESESRPATIRLALLAAQEQDFAQAETRYVKWLEAYPNDSGVQNLLANVHIQKGDQQAARRQYESMLPTDNPVVLNNLAWIYLESGDRRALDMARRADAASPKNPDIEDTLGWVLVQNGSAGDGVRYLRSSARARPDNATIQYHLGVAYEQLGDDVAARRSLEQALELGDFPERDQAQSLLNDL